MPDFRLFRLLFRTIAALPLAACILVVISPTSTFAWHCNCHSGPAGETCYSPCSWEMPGGGAPAGCNPGWKRSSSGGCIPQSAIECGVSQYCDPGYYCGKGNHCIQNGRADCGGGYSCPSGEYCTNNGCVPNGHINCGTFHCPADNRCGRLNCLPPGSVECGDGRYCDQGYECTPTNHCERAGTAAKRERFNQLKAQLSFLDKDIQGWINHLVDAGRANYEAKLSIEEWVDKKEKAREEAVNTAVGAIPELIRDQILEFAHWHDPPPDAGRLRQILVDFAQKLGITFRKVELSNHRFFLYAHELLKGLTSEELARHHVTHGEYLHALGALAEAAIAFSPESFPKDLISVGVADADIWGDDFYAYWITIHAAWSVNRELDIQSHELKQMAFWSHQLRHDMEEKRRLVAECRQVVAPEAPPSTGVIGCD